MKKIRCPFCYNTHDLKDLHVNCNEKECIYGFKKDDNGYLINDADKKKCLKKKGCSPYFHCIKHNIKDPSLKFANIIPFEFFSPNLDLPIALLGAKAAGKSNYVGAFVAELIKKLPSSFNCYISANSQEESIKKLEASYMEKLNNKKVVEGTNTDQLPPFIFPMTFNNSKKTIILTLYDTAGENLSSQKVQRTNKYISSSKALILLLDPLQIPKIREKLEGKVALPSINKNPADVLDLTVGLIRSNTKTRGKIKLPLAIAFTKMDVLEKFDIVGKNSALRKESEHLERGAFVKSDFEAVDIEISDLIDNYCPEIKQFGNRFKKVAYFGVSSLGSIPDGDKLIQKINPKRVLDPLLWLLSDYRIIKKVK